MENNANNDDDINKHKSFQKIFLLSNYFEEPKEKKNWFNNKFENYINTIKKDLDDISKDGRYNNIRKRIHLHPISLKKNNIYPNINKFAHILPNSIGNKFHLKKINEEKKVNISNIDDNSKNNSSFLNMENDKSYEKKNRANILNNSIDPNLIKERTEKNIYTLNLKLTSTNLPILTGVENKNKYINQSIDRISAKTDLLERKLIRQEKMRYIGFKSKYNRLYDEHKKIQIDIDQYINPKKYQKHRFNLNEIGIGKNEERFGDLKLLMKQITNKIKDKVEDRPTIKDVINEVNNFKFREKRLRERTKKNHAKFEYLVNDSNIIQKRIEEKYNQQNSEI